MSPMKRVSGYTIPMVPMHLAPMAPVNLVEQIRALRSDGRRRLGGPGTSGQSARTSESYHFSLEDMADAAVSLPCIWTYLAPEHIL